jgi:hypothetical protein
VYLSRLGKPEVLSRARIGDRVSSYVLPERAFCRRIDYNHDGSSLRLPLVKVLFTDSRSPGTPEVQRNRRLLRVSEKPAPVHFGNQLHVETLVEILVHCRLEEDILQLGVGQVRCQFRFRWHHRQK